MKHLIIIIIFFCCIACSNTRNFTYFKDISDTAINVVIPDTSYKELTVKPDDILLINISSLNPEASSYFNTPGTSLSNIPVNQEQTLAAGTGSGFNTYLVDKNGGIDLP